MWKKRDTPELLALSGAALTPYDPHTIMGCTIRVARKSGKGQCAHHCVGPSVCGKKDPLSLRTIRRQNRGTSHQKLPECLSIGWGGGAADLPGRQPRNLYDDILGDRARQDQCAPHPCLGA